MSVRLRVGQPDAGDPRVGGLPGGGQVGADRGDSQHPPAGRDHRAVRGERGAGVQHALAVGAGDRVAGARRLGVAGRGDHDGDRGAVAPAQRRVVGQPAGGGGVQQPGQRRLQQRQHHLGLGVAEAGVELDDAQARAR